RHSYRPLQRSRRDLLGHSARTRHRAARGDGADSVYSLLRLERLWADADLQWRLCDLVPRCSKTLATVTCLRRIGVPGDRDPGCRRAAARYSREGAAVAHGGSANSSSATVSHSAALSPLARWFRSTLTRSFLVEEGL